MYDHGAIMKAAGTLPIISIAMSLAEHYPAYGKKGPTCLITGLTSGSVATILIFLRIYVRLWSNKNGTAALLWAVAAWLLTVITQVFGVLSALHGLGNDEEVLVIHGTEHNFLKYLWFTVFFFCLAIATGKAAVAVFLLQINGITNPNIRRILIATAVINYLSFIPAAIYSQLHCTPYDALWNSRRQDQCNTSLFTALGYPVGAVAALSDFLLALLPSYMLWNPQMDRKLKYGSCVLLGLGVFAAVAAVARAWTTQYFDQPNSSYHLAKLFTWGEVEEWLVIIYMSIPPIWPLLKPLVERFTSIVTPGETRNTPTPRGPADYKMEMQRRKPPTEIHYGIGVEIASEPWSRKCPTAGVFPGTPDVEEDEKSLMKY